MCVSLCVLLLPPLSPPNTTEEANYVRFLDDATFEAVGHFQLRPLEMACSIVTCRLSKCVVLFLGHPFVRKSVHRRLPACRENRERQTHACLQREQREGGSPSV